jgi:hypothetical protein
MIDFYDEVVSATTLPVAQRTDSRVVSHGYAVQLEPGPWFWFSDLPPALVFGRAARMSAQCSGYGVHHAAHEIRSVPSKGTDRRTLYVIGGNLDRQAGEKEQLQLWVDGVDDRSSHWQGAAVG